MIISDNTPDAQNPFIDVLRQLISTCGTNKHDHAKIGIEVCIENGVTEGSEIVRLLGLAGLNRKNVGRILAKLRGINPDRHNWWRDDSGHYHLHA